MRTSLDENDLDKNESVDHMAGSGAGAVNLPQHLRNVMPAQAGTHERLRRLIRPMPWVPAFAGMTMSADDDEPG